MENISKEKLDKPIFLITFCKYLLEYLLSYLILK
jgi:hypothetical protein